MYTVSNVLFHKHIGVNVAVTNCMSYFYMFVPTKDTMKLAIETWETTKEFGLFYVAFLTVPLFIQRYQFIIVKVNLPTPSNHVPSDFMLDFKRLRLNILEIVTLLTLKVILGDYCVSIPPRRRRG